MIGPQHEVRWVEPPPLTRQLLGAQDAVAAAIESPVIVDSSVVPVQTLVASTPATSCFWFSSEFASFLLVLAALYVLYQMFDWCRVNGLGPIWHLFGIMTDDQLSGHDNTPQGPANGPQGPAPDDSTGHGNDNGDPSHGHEEESSSNARKEALRLRWVHIQDRLLKRDRRNDAIRDLRSQHLAAKSQNKSLKAQLGLAFSTIKDQASIIRKQAEQLDKLPVLQQLVAEAKEKNHQFEEDVAAADQRTDDVQAELDAKDQECHQHLTEANQRTAEVQGQLDEEKTKSSKLSDDLDAARREVVRGSETLERAKKRIEDLEEANGITAGFAEGDASYKDLKELTEKLASSEKREEEQAETIDHLNGKLAIKEKTEEENAECIEGLIAELFKAQDDVRECEESRADRNEASAEATRQLTEKLLIANRDLKGSRALVAILLARLANCRCGLSKTADELLDTPDDGPDGDAEDGDDSADKDDSEDDKNDAGNGSNSEDDDDDDSDDAPGTDGAAIFNPSSTEDKDKPETSKANPDNSALPQPQDAPVEHEVLASTPPVSPLAASPTDSASSLGSLFASDSVFPHMSTPVSGSGPEFGTLELGFGPAHAAEPDVKDEDEDEDENDNDAGSADSVVSSSSTGNQPPAGVSQTGPTPPEQAPVATSPAESFVVVSPPESGPIASPEGQWASPPVSPLALPSPLELGSSPEYPPSSASASGVNANPPKRRSASGRAFKVTKGRPDKTDASATRKRSHELVLRFNAQARFLHRGPPSPVTPGEVESLASSMASLSVHGQDQDGPGDALMLEPPVEEDSEMRDAEPLAEEDVAMTDAEPPVKEDTDMDDADQDGPGSTNPPEDVEKADTDERPSHHALVFRDSNSFHWVMDLRTLPPCSHLPHDEEMPDIPSGMEEGDAGQPMDLGSEAATGAGIGPVSAFDLGSRRFPPKQKAKEGTDNDDHDDNIEGPVPRDIVAERIARMDAEVERARARLTGEKRETERLKQELGRKSDGAKDPESSYWPGPDNMDSVPDPNSDMDNLPLTLAEYQMLAAEARRPRDAARAQQQGQDDEGAQEQGQDGEGDPENEMDADTDSDATEYDSGSERAYQEWRAERARRAAPPWERQGA
ncbi:MAG: hypothetical protein Q9194_001509 [Teloschistes cf. exilis]